MATLVVVTIDNKQIIERALSGLIASGEVDSLAGVLHDQFVHHRPDSTSGKAEWLAAVRAVPIADLRVEIHHLLADGAHVVMHSTRRLAGHGAAITGVDIWRFQDGLIVEGWEILEPATEAAAHMVWWKSSEMA